MDACLSSTGSLPDVPHFLLDTPTLSFIPPFSPHSLHTLLSQTFSCHTHIYASMHLYKIPELQMRKTCICLSNKIVFGCIYFLWRWPSFILYDQNKIPLCINATFSSFTPMLSYILVDSITELSWILFWPCCQVYLCYVVAQSSPSQYQERVGLGHHEVCLVFWSPYWLP